MLNSKQRAWLRSQANSMDCQFQIGKGEITDTVRQGLDEILTTHELLKVSILKAVDTSPAEIARNLAEAVGAEVVQVIGRRFVLYRFSAKLAKAGKGMVLPFR